MPHMSGVDFLKAAKPIFPDAKSVLLTAYADTDAAISAINEAHVSYYLTKPWDPPEERMFPALEDVILDWSEPVPSASDSAKPYRGIRVIGHRWDPIAHSTKDFLARNQVPYQWIDVEGKVADPEMMTLIEELGREAPCLPLVIFEDQEKLSQPTTIDIAERLGLRTRPEISFYDLIIIGADPAGLAAAVYGGSEGLKTLLIEREAPGGQAGTSSRIENYLGFPNGITGGDLTSRAVTQARRFGVEMLTPVEVHSLSVRDQYRVVHLLNGGEVSCHALLIATGVSYRKLDVPGIDKLTGAGVYYGAAMAEALSCTGDDVFIVGGANSAGQAAMHFAKYASSVTMVVRGASLDSSMSYYLIQELQGMPNVRVLTHSEVDEVFGEQSLESVKLRNNVTGECSQQQARALFIFIGAQPRTECLKDIVRRDERGFILAGADLYIDGKRPADWPLDRDPFLLETSVPGVFVAGDVRHGSVKRVASGVGEGAIAIQFVHQYLSDVR